MAEPRILIQELPRTPDGGPWYAGTVYGLEPERVHTGKRREVVC